MNPPQESTTRPAAVERKYAEHKQNSCILIAQISYMTFMTLRATRDGTATLAGKISYT